MPRRLHLLVMNLPLQKELVCGPVTFQPIPEGQDELKKRTSMDDRAVVSAEAVVHMPDAVTANNYWSWAESLPITEIELLLSLAERRYIETIRPQIEELVGNEWQYRAGHAYFAHSGSAHGVPWHSGHDDLEGFVNRSLPILQDKDRGGKWQLILSMKFYRTNFEDDFVELQYIKTWTALEILYTKFFDSNRILPNNQFKRLSKKIKELLDHEVADGKLDQTQSNLIARKLTELNRKSAVDQADSFFERVFQDHPVQLVKEEDIVQFVDIRNQITHQGVMSPREHEKYGDFLHEQHMRLKALLERVYLALLGQDANLMTFSWTNWMNGR